MSKNDRYEVFDCNMEDDTKSLKEKLNSFNKEGYSIAFAFSANTYSSNRVLPMIRFILEKDDERKS